MRKGEWMVLLVLAAALCGGCAQSTASGSLPDEIRTPDTSEALVSEPASENDQMQEPATELETEAATEEIIEPVIQTVTITAAGDCTLGATQTHGYAGSFHEYYDKNGADYFFAGVRDIFEADDFTLVNLECVLSESEERVEKTWNLKGKPEYAGIMTGSSVEGCSLGNNHTYDYGETGLSDTRAVVDAAGIVYGYNGHTAVYTTDSGIVIGIVSASLLSQSKEREDYIRDGIAALREQGADLVIASCHWGIEGDHYPNDYQRTMAHQIIDWGADLLIGTHPHVLQGIELYNGKVICYSLGNFCFGGNRNPQDKDTALYQQTFTFADGVLQEDVNAGIVPCSISSVDSRNDFQPTVAEGGRKERILSNMNDYSAKYSDIGFDGNGKLVLKMENEQG